MMFDLFEEVRRIQERINRLFEELERIGPSTMRVGATSFPVDIIDEQDCIKVVADLPGYKKEDIEVWIEDNQLVIKAERKEEKVKKDVNYIKQERVYGKVQRTIPIPAEIEEDKIKATYNDGVLEIILPKSEKTQRKIIKIE
ncbi:MAG TPA: Hsp20/alpha crystallin family protein [Archaeoglobus profundus]|nr:Hsp20/alpha crystallin family protein [Archaeoglobus profundus]HIP57815.1 Hsp20/alpha crystallin family protein [Archaeoglobus profundus]